MSRLLKKSNPILELKKTIRARIINRDILIKAIDYLADNIEQKNDKALDSIDRLAKLLPFVMYKEISPDLLNAKNPGLLDAPGITFNVTNYFDKRMDKIAKLSNDTEIQATHTTELD